MSLPKELRDQLLSGYLDDVLSSDEHSRVEQLLESDADLAAELAQLRGLRRSLQAISEADSDIKLDGGFADRVLGAAVARARAEGYGDDHPLVRLVGHPSTTRSESGSSSWRYAGLLVGLAASIVIAVVVFRPKTDQDPGFAVAENTPAVPQENPLIAPDSLTESPMIANSDVTDPVIPSKVDPIVEPESTPTRQPESPPQTTEAIAQSPMRPRTDSVEPPLVTEIDVPNADRGAVLVLDVRRTPAGRQSGAVAEAMKLASISPASEKKITDEIAGFVNELPQQGDKDVSVLYLQAPAKSVDRFYHYLLDDQEGIESVGLSLAENAPIMKVVDKLSPDPTTVRHLSLELASDNGFVEQFAGQLGQLPYIPLNREMVSAMPTKGPDVPAQILVLVR